MSAPQGGYPPQGYPQQDPYAGQQPYDDQAQAGVPGMPTPPPGEQHQETQHGKKKKRGYAAQAYDFGAGGNAPAGGVPPVGGETFMPGAATVGGAPYGGFAPPIPPPSYSGNQGYVDSPAPGMGAMAGLGGYQPPDAAQTGYPAQSPGVAGITQGMGQMGMGGPQTVQGGPNAQKLQLNQLYPTDLLNQPFNVAELELPPPPIILPPNVCWAPDNSLNL